MKCLFLVAGYATRLFPLTKDRPKALLNIGGKPILDYVLEKVNAIDEIDEIYVVSNDKFYPHFCEWADEKMAEAEKAGVPCKKISVANDNTTDDSNKLGAIGDIQYAIEYFNIDDDMMILAGDNLFSFGLVELRDFFKKYGKDSICVHKVEEKSELQRMGVAQLEDGLKVIGMEEKPQEPKSNTAVDPFYLYTRDTVKLFKTYLDEGNNPDAPGNFPSWLHKRKDVYAYWLDGVCIDIGTVANYEYVNENYDKLFPKK